MNNDQSLSHIPMEHQIIYKSEWALCFPRWAPAKEFYLQGIHVWHDERLSNFRSIISSDKKIFWTFASVCVFFSWVNGFQDQMQKSIKQLLFVP